MILDKTSIEEILYLKEADFDPIREEHKDGILIRTDTEQNYFSKDQIGNDSIDLRIANYGYRMSTDYNYINTLETGSFEKYYEKINLPVQGYKLEPGGLLFVPTYERIAISGDLIGRITGRSVFARMGLSVHCTQDKFSSGINSVAGLQVINNSPTPLLIFPHQKLAQILIEKTGPNRNPYSGTYCGEREMKLPVVKDTDLNQYDGQTKEIITKIVPKKKVIRGKHIHFVLPLIKLIITALVTILMGAFGIAQNMAAMCLAGGMGVLISIGIYFIEITIKKDIEELEKA